MLLYPTFQINPPLYYTRLLIVVSTQQRALRCSIRRDSLCRYLIGHSKLPESEGTKGLLAPVSPGPGTEDALSNELTIECAYVSSLLCR